MSVVNISTRNGPDADHDHLAQLAVTLSRRLTRVPLDDMGVAIAEALAEIAAVTRVESCRLLEFTELAAVARVHSAAGIAKVSHGSLQARDEEDWLVERLWRGEVVSISRPEELPREAIASREQSRVIGAYSIL